MDISEFSQKPDSRLVYAKNEVPPFVISTGNSLLAVLSIGEEVIFRGSYSPNFEGKITIDFKGLYDDYLETIVPTNSTEILHTSYCREFTATFSVIAGEDTPGDNNSISWRVANAKVPADTNFNTWSQNNFLTNQPVEKTTNNEAPEWLTFFNLDNATGIKIVFYLKNGQTSELGPASVSITGCVSLNVSYNLLIRAANVLPSQLKGYYDIVLLRNNQEVARQRYIYAERTAKEKYFCFVNALGGIDTMICSGENVLQPETTHNVGCFAGHYTALDDTDDMRQWQQNTGMLPMRQRNWVYELLTMKQGAVKYDPEAMDYYPIVVNSDEISMSDHGQLVSATFGYILDEPDNTIPVTERAVDRFLHQSVADTAQELDDMSEVAVIKFEPSERGEGYETDAVELPTLKVYVVFAKTEQPVTVNYLIGGDPAGSFNLMTDDSPYVIVIDDDTPASLQFTSQENVLQDLIVHYYPIEQNNE